MYGDSLAFFCYYTSTSPQRLRTVAGDERERWYGVRITPSAVFDGRLGPQVEVPDSFYPVYRDMIDGARSVPAVVEMRLDSLRTRVDSQVAVIGLAVNPTDSAVDTMTGLRLVTVVFEDSVPYEMLGDTFYARMVARAVLADTFGIPLTLKFGREFDTTLRVPAREWNVERLGVVAFLQDCTSRRVLQSVVRRRLPVRR